MFSFHALEEVRMIADATVEKDDVRLPFHPLFYPPSIDCIITLVMSQSHAGKVVERSWYNRSKLTFPASRWENFSPDLQAAYTIR